MTATQPDATPLQIATKLVTTNRFGSPSMISRVLRQKHGLDVSFRDACNLLDEMEKRGIVGPQHGSLAREVFMDPQQAEAALANTPA
jgi:DNA segregation ATPase FtsK/SpoIIIE-like protein